MAKKKKATKKKATRKKATKKKSTRKKVTKKKAAKKKSTKKKATKKKATKKKAKKKTTKKAVKKKATKKKAARKKVTKKKASIKTTKKAATKKPVNLSIPVSQVAVGKKVPTLTLEATGGQNITLPESGKKTVVFFYPKDSTPGCTIEGQDFTRLHKDFNANGAEVFGVSRDSIKSHENFKSKQNYSIDLLSDNEEKACSVFGVIKLKNMYGKQVRGIERSTFVLDEDGVLVQEWRGVKVPGHAEEVLAYLKNQ